MVYLAPQTGKQFLTQLFHLPLNSNLDRLCVDYVAANVKLIRKLLYLPY